MKYETLQNGSDIRGVAMGEHPSLTKEAVKDLAAGFARWLKAKTGKEGLVIAVGRDSRLTGSDLLQQAAEGLMTEGVTVLDCGLATTPAMFMSTVFPESDTDGAIMITASHLPMDRNGMKFFTREGGLGKADIRMLVEEAQTPAGKAESGTLLPFSLLDVYAGYLQKMIREKVGKEDKPLAGLHIVVDAGNGAGGFYATEVLRPLGADISGSQFLDPDGTFPNHIPNPEDKEAMASICQAVRDNQADLGLIFDTDVDRSSAVDENGEPVSRNGIIALASLIAADGHPGTTIVTDSVTSDELSEFLKKHGLQHHRFKRGYKNVIDEAKRLNAEGIDTQLAIETSGHTAMKENRFLDDGAYLATRIVIEAAKGPIASRIADLKHPLEEEEIRIRITDPNFQETGLRVLEDLVTYATQFEGVHRSPDDREGVRLNFDRDHGDGWLLMRLSLHDPILPVNLESRKEGGVQQMKNWLREFLQSQTGLDVSVLNS